VGKSSAFNRILGRREAIVNRVAGVTRDRHVHVCEWNDRDFLLIDTGGYELDSDDELIESIRHQAEIAIQESDLILFMVDGQEGLTPLDEEISLILRKTGKPVYLCINKIDVKAHEIRMHEFYKLGYNNLFAVSAVHGHGFYELLDEVVDQFPGPESEADRDKGLRLALVGRPNVGKSSIINAILGYDRLITSDLPGTTRDSTDSYYKSSHGEVRFIDTAGIRRKRSVRYGVEKICVIKAMKSIRRAQVVAIILDFLEAATDQDLKIAGLSHEEGKSSILVLNKSDLLTDDKDRMRGILETVRDRFRFLSYAPILQTSAVTGHGLDRLIQMSFHVLGESAKQIETPVLNKFIQSVTRRHTHPAVRGKNIKFFYGTQLKMVPPTFILFCNYPESVEVSYRRYLRNCLREEFGFEGSPIRILLRMRK
jgi:GTP-binding protein